MYSNTRAGDLFVFAFPSCFIWKNLRLCNVVTLYTKYGVSTVDRKKRTDSIVEKGWKDCSELFLL